MTFRGVTAQIEQDLSSNDSEFKNGVQIITSLKVSPTHPGINEWDFSQNSLHLSQKTSLGVKSWNLFDSLSYG